MALDPAHLTLEIRPEERFQIIDITQRIDGETSQDLSNYAKAAYSSRHTTAGYLEQSMSARLLHSRNHLDPYFNAFRNLFPPNANYRHDQLELRAELSDAQRANEPQNADSHLIFIGSGLKNCVTYLNKPGQPVYFIELDGINTNDGNSSRRRRTDLLYYNDEEVVSKISIPISVSKHTVDSINLRDPRTGFMDKLTHLLQEYDIENGRIDIALRAEDRHAGLTVNEYETLLMRHDLIEVLRNPVRFMALQGKHMLLDPKAIPSKTLNYAKYDLVQIFNELMDAFRCSSSVVERILSKFIAVPAERFLRMKRGISLLAAADGDKNRAKIIQGTYQSPILVQWQAAKGQTRYLDVTFTRFQ